MNKVLCGLTALANGGFAFVAHSAAVIHAGFYAAVAVTVRRLKARDNCGTPDDPRRPARHGADLVRGQFLHDWPRQF